MYIGREKVDVHMHIAMQWREGSRENKKRNSGMMIVMMVDGAGVYGRVVACKEDEQIIESLVFDLFSLPKRLDME